MLRTVAELGTPIYINVYGCQPARYARQSSREVLRAACLGTVGAMSRSGLRFGKGAADGNYALLGVMERCRSWALLLKWHQPQAYDPPALGHNSRREPERDHGFEHHCPAERRRDLRVHDASSRRSRQIIEAMRTVFEPMRLGPPSINQ